MAEVGFQPRVHYLIQALGFMHITQLIASHTAMERLVCTRYPTQHLIYLIVSKYHLYTDEDLGRGV